MKLFIRLAWLWMLMMVASWILSLINVVHVFTYPTRMVIAGMAVWGACAFLVAFTHVRRPK